MCVLCVIGITCAINMHAKSRKEKLIKKIYIIWKKEQKNTCDGQMPKIQYFFTIYIERKWKMRNNFTQFASLAEHERDSK